MADSAPSPQSADAARVLVAYETGHGSTSGIAERIAARLTGAGHVVDLRPAHEVETLDGYGAVVLGSPVYDQQWQPGAVAFVNRFEPALRERRVWVFSVGSFDDTGRLGRFVRMEPAHIDEVCRRVGARDYRVFAGVMVASRWPARGKLFFRAFGGRFGDRRNWPTIDAWSDQISDGLR